MLRCSLRKSLEVSSHALTLVIKTIVLDIDETLVFATPDKTKLAKGVDKKISFKFRDKGFGKGYLYLAYRPYL